MCNINIILDKSGKDNNKITELMNFMSFNSYLGNNDGEGAYFENEGYYWSRRSLAKLKFSEPCSFIATHQRLSTSGFSESNTHPHETKDFILMHNGIFSGLGNKDTSDTKEYSNLLQANFKKNIIKAINDTNKVISGSWSIFLKNTSDGRKYYYKNKHTNMFAIENKRYLIMSTIKENVELAAWYLDINAKIFEPQDNTLYLIHDKKGLIGIAQLETQKEKVQVHLSSDLCTNDYDYWSKEAKAWEKIFNKGNGYPESNEYNWE